jgi:hypothetical protein
VYLHSGFILARPIDRKLTLWLGSLAATFGTAALAAQGSLRVMLIAGLLVYGAGAGLTIAFDVRMYVRRWRLSAAGVYLPLATGLRQPASPAPDAGLGGLARGGALDDPLFQHRRVDEPGHGAPRRTGLALMTRSARRPSVPSAPLRRRKSICDQAMSGGDGVLLLVDQMPQFQH